MKNKITVLFALFCAVVLRADPFTGSMIYTILQSNDNQLMGQTFTGSYSYDSDTADGTFDHGSVHGEIDLPNPIYSHAIDLSIWTKDVTLIVTDGLISFFQFCPDMGPTSADFYRDTFGVSNSAAGEWIKGTIQWTQPQGLIVSAESVPDLGRTAYLLVLALMSLAAVPRPKACKSL